MAGREQVDAFLLRLELLTSEELLLLHEQKERLSAQRRSDEWMKEQWRKHISSTLKLPAAQQQTVKSRLREVTRHKLDLPELKDYSNPVSGAVIDTAMFALQAMLRRDKLTDEEYQWFIGPYLTAGFPREIFYPEET